MEKAGDVYLSYVSGNITLIEAEKKCGVIVDNNTVEFFDLHGSTYRCPLRAELINKTYLYEPFGSWLSTRKTKLKTATPITKLPAVSYPETKQDIIKKYYHKSMR